MSCRTCGAGCKGKGKSQDSSTVLENGQVARPGDWICPFCNDLQFARNAACRNCGGGGKGGCGGKGGYGKGGAGFGKGFGRGNQVHGENLVYIGNLSYEVSWQDTDLKDHMKQAGSVEFCSILTDDGTDYGRSKGAGCVRFATDEEVQRAIDTLAETELKGRRIPDPCRPVGRRQRRWQVIAAVATELLARVWDAA
ncbi:unnamed protein product [Prorocentrum cordatum]|uniref:Uncharacterized protein n=1 Tax=Prorocentrum cordatum TaxID=2364126 RepID=A0ABN9UKE4_9DINO|nr:unnamed protein product [Polarella glacialis]